MDTDQGQDIIDAELRCHGTGADGADGQTGVTLITKCRVKNDFVTLQGEGTGITCGNTIAAMITDSNGVGIVTGGARQIAALKEQDQAIARSVNKGARQDFVKCSQGRVHDRRHVVCDQVYP